MAVILSLFPATLLGTTRFLLPDLNPIPVLSSHYTESLSTYWADYPVPFLWDIW